MKKQSLNSLLTRTLAAVCGFVASCSAVFGDTACVLPTPQQQPFNPPIRIQLPDGTNGVSANATGNPASFIKVTLRNVPPGFSITNSTYLGWCVDASADLCPHDVPDCLKTIYKPIVFNSCDPASLAAAGLPSTNWNQVNYIINNKPVWASLGYNVSEIQCAIWRFIGFNAAVEASMLSGNFGFGFPAGTANHVATIVAFANINGSAFVPGPGQVVAVVLYLPANLQDEASPHQFQTGQLNFIEVVCQPPPPPGSIGDTVFCDFNGNGTQDPGEPGIPGVKITLVCSTASGPINQTQFTNASGKYLFTNIPAGSCTVTVDPTTAPPDCNKIIRICPLSRTVNLAQGQSFLDADFCFAPNLGRIGDTVFCDFNENGVQNPGEPGIPGVKVTLTCLTASGTITKTAITDADGKYLFIDLAPGNCTVVVDPTTAPADCNRIITNCPLRIDKILAQGEVFLDADFCFAPSLGKIGDTVFCDLNGNGVQNLPEDAGIPNVKVTLTCILTGGGTLTLQQLTDIKGNYLFNNIPPGTCIVMVDKTTLPADCNMDVPGCPSTIPVTLGLGQVFLDADFCFTKPGCNLSVAAFCTEPKPPGDNDDCDGSKIKSVKMVYTAEDCSFSSNNQPPDKWFCTAFGPLQDNVYIIVSDQATLAAAQGATAKSYFKGFVAKDNTYDILATNAGATTLAANSYIYILKPDKTTLLQQVKFHTSCSQPIAVGDQFGANLIVEMSFADGHTTTLPNANLDKNCTITLGDANFCPPGIGNKIKALELIYTKENCSFSSNSQPADKWSCTDFGALQDNVFIRVTEKSSPTDLGGRIYFQGNVTKDVPFFATAANANSTEFRADTYIHIFASQGGARLQSIKFHTSCSQPLNAGDQFGSIVLFSADTTKAGTIGLGGDIKFVYKVTNTGTTAVTNVIVTDFMGAVPGSPIPSIAPGQTVELSRTVTTSTNITNTVTVFQSGGCQDSDTTTVTVVTQPPGPTSCTAAISKMLLKYTGANVAGPVTVKFLGSSGASATYTLPGGLLNGTILSSPAQNDWTIDSTVSGDSSLGSKTTITINGVAEVIHTSCSTPFLSQKPAPLDNPKGQPSTLWFVEAFQQKQ